VSQRPAVAARSVQVAGSAAGIVGHRNEPSRCGQVSSPRERCELASRHEQGGTEDRANAGHGLDDRRLTVLVEDLGDLRSTALMRSSKARTLPASSAMTPAAMSCPPAARWSAAASTVGRDRTHYAPTPERCSLTLEDVDLRLVTFSLSGAAFSRLTHISNARPRLVRQQRQSHAWSRVPQAAVIEIAAQIRPSMSRSASSTASR
jgi:hypothetical protein